MGPYTGYLTPSHMPLEKEEKILNNEFCFQHSDYPFNSYCEDCEFAVCLQDTIKSHKPYNHNVITLEQKCKQMKARLSDTLKNLSQGTLKQRLNFLNEEIREIESATMKGKDGMRHQCQNVITQLNYLLNKQTNVLDDKKRDQMNRLNREIENTNKNFQKMKMKEEEITNLLVQLPSATFVQQCREFFRKLDLSPHRNRKVPC